MSIILSAGKSSLSSGNKKSPEQSEPSTSSPGGTNFEPNS